MEPILITEPVTIRFYRSGGKGGYGYSSSPMHRLTERHTAGDLTACGVFIKGKYALYEGKPKAKDVTKYGLCQTCWS